MMSKINPMNAATVFNTPSDIEAVINAIRGGNWTDTKELIDAIVASGYGAYGNVMLDNVYVYGRSTSAYRAATMDIWNQGNGRTSGGAGINYAGKTVNAVGAVANVAWIKNRYASKSFKYGVRLSDGRKVSGKTLGRLGRMQVHKGLTALGKNLSYASIITTAIDAFNDGLENHHVADLVITAVLIYASATISAPIVTSVSLIYCALDFGVTMYTGSSITENLFDQ